jgi:murein L,D-transpeptidase YcbB/YkuD
MPSRFSRALLLAAGLTAVSGFGARPAERPSQTLASAPLPAAVPLDLGEEIAGFYLDRDFRPLWVAGGSLRPEAERLLRRLGQAGMVDSDLQEAVATSRTGDRRALARADLLLTRALSRHVAELRRPPATSSMRYIDDGLAPHPVELRPLLEAAAAAPSLAAHLDQMLRVNPALDGLRVGLAAWRARWSRLPQVEIPAGPALSPGATGERVGLLRRRLGLERGGFDAALAVRLRDFQADHGLTPSAIADRATIEALNRGAGHYERLILANIERARAIPARPGGRYILVDAAAARLWMVEDDRIVGGMKVIVGKQGMQTPAMAASIDHAVLNPYWNLPPDLIRDRARKALRRGSRAIAAERLQVLSDWSPTARVLDPARVDWRAVASGRRYVNLRQRPGPRNMMGAIKFMMPNPLGIYLHDTPARAHFARDDRRISSGCVRLEDAARLARWLFRGAPPVSSGAAEQRVDLPERVPVYITYLTAIPSRGRIVFQPDRYGRDLELLARMTRRAMAAES